jgi:pyridinium-3,5-bisthiocarboxylic acid mononucleotide nickel chelatase
MKILYCDCFSGISGDMFLSAMLDAGLPIEHLKTSLEKIFPAVDVGVNWSRVKKGAVVAGQLDIEVFNKELETHHRHFTDIAEMIQNSQLNGTVKNGSLKIFTVLAEAEAKVHGTTMDHVHFHEVGAIDSIIDIVGSAIALDYYHIELFYSSPLPLGSGSVKTDHGVLPLPAPATAELMRISKASVTPSVAQVELVTPTGAAILAAFAKFEKPAMQIQHVGVGSGTRDLPWPNILRIFIGEKAINRPDEKVLIETNIDDMNSQVLGYLMQKLLKHGALDVFFTPIYMKKNRPATQVSVIATSEDEEKFSRMLLRETSTMGVRVQPMNRHEADREMVSVQTLYGMVPVKVKYMDQEIIQISPEYEDCVKIASQYDIPLQDVFEMVKDSYKNQYPRTMNFFRE